jgi:predicted PurR-regulated permease PerM
MASAGVTVTYAAVRVLASMSSMLVLIGVAFFLALGLEPAVSWFVKRTLPRWAAMTLVFVIFLALTGAFTAAAIPPLAQQAGESTRHRTTFNRPRTIHRPSAGSTNGSIFNNGSPTPSTDPADRSSRTWSPPAARYSGHWPMS